ncbi:MAG: isoprenyl transferase [Lachnospiraceae bacterium]|nr:isoprenyl transferase [Lachnospiraceae bacterium]
MEAGVPEHVAIIMDGNGRWAKRRGMPRTFGHKEGAKTVEKICRDADEIGIRYLTLYAFSTENWNRPEKEVSALMKLFLKYLDICYKNAMKEDMCCRIIGDKTRLSEELNESIRKLETDTAGHKGLHLQLAINYGARDEITRLVKRVAEDASKGTVSPDDIDEAFISEHLDTAGIPDPDLLIRTCGEQRISNYLLWQCAYTEFYYTDVAWPDFSREELVKAVEAYRMRDRRYGKV